MKVNVNSQKIKEVLSRGVEAVYPSVKELEDKLLVGKKLRIYCGYDPSSFTLHIGHMITLRKLAQFQELGHEIIVLLGDFTGMIGDPTDKKATRKKLTRVEVIKNAQNYKEQAGRFLKFTGTNPAKILYNSQWLDKLSFVDLIELSSNFTVQQMIVRDMFQERIKNKKPIFLHEFLYPLAQGYDSVAMDIDLEVGGKDQTFNMLCGRALLKSLKSKEKFILATKLLTDAAGKKMGKTEGNIIDLAVSPEEMYGQVMAWSDDIIFLGFELCTDWDLKEIDKMASLIKSGKTNPRDVKKTLAQEIVNLNYGPKAAEAAAQEFTQVFKEKKLPSKIPHLHLTEKTLNLLDLLLKTKIVDSKLAGKRLVLQRGIKINGFVQSDWQKEVEIKKGLVIQAGKRKFIKLV